jgi:hypothetical protein
MHHAVYLPLCSILFTPRALTELLTTCTVHQSRHARARARAPDPTGGRFLETCVRRTYSTGGRHRHMHDMTPRRAGPPGLTAVQAGVW